MNVQDAFASDHDQRVREDGRAIGVQVRERLERELDLEAVGDVEERASGAERAVQRQELRPRCRNERMQMPLDEVRVGCRRDVQVAEDHAGLRQAVRKLRGDHLRVALDLQTGALPDDTGRLQHPVAVHGLGATTRRERAEVQVEARQVRVTPLLGLLRRDRHRLELPERARDAGRR